MYPGRQRIVCGHNRKGIEVMCHNRFVGLICLTLVLVLSAFTPMAAGSAKLSEEIPRIALIGDSWTGFLWAFRSFSDVLPDYPGCGNYVEVGAATAVMGAKAYEMLTPARLESITGLLTENSTVDVVVMTLGGNDFLSGTYPAEDHTGPEYEWRCPATYPDNPNELVLDTIKRDIGDVIDHVLAIRPDIRVVIAGYTYGGRTENNGCTLEENQRGFVDMELHKQELAQERDRVYYVSNFGLMQWNFGIYYTQDPADPLASPPDIPAQDPSIPYPPDVLSQADPGGLPQYLAPLESLLDNDIHLTDAGYELVARRLMDRYIEEWLNYPKCFEILPLAGKAPEYNFQVTFSEAVSGVDVSDFSVTLVSKSGYRKAASILSVTPASGPAAVYTVTADLDGMDGAAEIQLLDDDSITDADTIPLGGAGAGNGAFTVNGLMNFQELPIPEDSDFNGALAYIAQQTEPYEGLIGGFTFAPESLDCNGTISLDTIADLIDNYEDGQPLPIPRNGLLDDFEFAVIEACLNDAGIDNTARGGVSHAMAAAAWNNNIGQMQSDLGGVDDIAANILPGLDTFLAGLLTIGDQPGQMLVSVLMGPLALGGDDLQEQFPINVTPPNMANYEMLPEYFAWYGDADGDGYTNAEEYVWFACDGREAYAAAALDPAKHPRTPGGYYETGSFLRMAVSPEAAEPPAEYPHLMAKDTVFQWYRDGEPVLDGGLISGATSRVLTIIALTEEDEGRYTCVYDEGDEKAPVTWGPVHIRVADVVPGVHGAALALLALCIAFLAIWRFPGKTGSDNA
jgi:lysophospholipase L1-like esterase